MMAEKSDVEVLSRHMCQRDDRNPDEIFNGEPRWKDYNATAVGILYVLTANDRAKLVRREPTEKMTRQIWQLAMAFRQLATTEEVWEKAYDLASPYSSE